MLVIPSHSFQGKCLMMVQWRTLINWIMIGCFWILWTSQQTPFFFLKTRFIHLILQSFRSCCCSQVLMFAKYLSALIMQLDDLVWWLCVFAFVKPPLQQLESLVWERSGNLFVCSHNDGGYSVWAVTSGNTCNHQPVSSTIPYGEKYTLRTLTFQV